MSGNFDFDFNLEDILLANNNTETDSSLNYNNTLGKRSRPKDLDDNSPPLKKKKSSKIDDTTPDLIVTMSREQLLRSSRADLDAFVKSVTNGRKLTKEERKEVSRQRKLIKNRNSAAASRKRKKEHQNILENQHSDLLNSQSLVKQRLASLQTENEKLHQEIGFINNLIQSNPFTKSIWDKTQQAKKQFEMASPSLLLTAKYILVFIMLINFVFLSSVSNEGSITQNTWEPKYSSFENESQKIISTENLLLSNTSNSRIPTLMPPSNLPPLLLSNNSTNIENDLSKSEKEFEFPIFDDEDKPCEILPFDETLPDWMQREFAIPDVVADQYITNLLSNSASVALSTSQTHHELKHK